jgi:hypothetical protein
MSRLFESIIKSYKKITLFFTLVVISLLFPQTASSQTYQTPGHKNTRIFAPASWHLGQGYIACDTVCNRNNYYINTLVSGKKQKIVWKTSDSRLN